MQARLACFIHFAHPQLPALCLQEHEDLPTQRLVLTVNGWKVGTTVAGVALKCMGSHSAWLQPPGCSLPMLSSTFCHSSAPAL